MFMFSGHRVIGSGMFCLLQESVESFTSVTYSRISLFTFLSNPKKKIPFFSSEPDGVKQTWHMYRIVW